MIESAKYIRIESLIEHMDFDTYARDIIYNALESQNTWTFGDVDLSLVGNNIFLAWLVQVIDEHDGIDKLDQKKYWEILEDEYTYIAL